MSLEVRFLAIGSARDWRPYREPVYFFVFYKEIVSHIYIFCNNWDANDTYLNHFIASFKSTDNVSLSVLLLYIMYFYKNDIKASLNFSDAFFIDYLSRLFIAYCASSSVNFSPASEVSC